MGGRTAYDAIKAHLDGKKTPYQLDLEVKDRKPSIIPKVGDRVKIKSREWYEKWKDEDEDVDFPSLPNFFAKGMKEHCGKIVTISDEIGFGFKVREDDKYYVWLPEFFEEVYPMQEQLSSKFPRIDLSSPSLFQSPYEVSGSDAIAVKRSDFAAKVEETAKRLAAYSLIQGLTAKPKLKQIKTTHLLRFKKL